jgi:hypothetical protein
LVRLLVIVGAAIEMFRVYEVALCQGKGSFALLTAAIGMVFLVAVTAIGLAQFEMNERFVRSVLVPVSPLLHQIEI